MGQKKTERSVVVSGLLRGQTRIIEVVCVHVCILSVWRDHVCW